MKGILFTVDNLKAIREHKKTQTRRVNNLRTINDIPDDWELMPGHDNDSLIWLFRSKELNDIFPITPRYQKGETAYLKEPVEIYDNTVDWEAKYLDGLTRIVHPPTDWISKHVVEGYKKYTTLFMPQWAARDFITFTDVRPERLHDISEEDAKAEGAECVIWHGEHAFKYDKFIAVPTYKAGFANMWDMINKDYPFDGNYWVWRYVFKLEDTNGLKLSRA